MRKSGLGLLTAALMAAAAFADSASAATISFGGSFSGVGSGGSPPVFNESFSGTGTDATFGAFNITESATIDLTGAPTVQVSNGNVAFDFVPGGFTASFTGTGTASGPSATVAITFSILSGLLSGETGTLNGTGIFNSDTRVLDVTYNGTITGPGPLLGFIDGPTVDVSATPLPATLPLFVSGLGGLGLLGWRRKRKNSGGLAPA